MPVYPSGISAQGERRPQRPREGTGSSGSPGAPVSGDSDHLRVIFLSHWATTPAPDSASNCQAVSPVLETCHLIKGTEAAWETQPVLTSLPPTCLCLWTGDTWQPFCDCAEGVKNITESQLSKRNVFRTIILALVWSKLQLAGRWLQCFTDEDRKR